jgi:hypothetical protein
MNTEWETFLKEHQPPCFAKNILESWNPTPLLDQEKRNDPLATMIPRAASEYVQPCIVLVETDGSEGDVWWLAITLPLDLCERHAVLSKEKRNLTDQDVMVLYLKVPSMQVVIYLFHS